MAEKFSLVIPVYNVKNYLSKCINSVLSQTYDDYEIILVDDGSTDGSSALCDEFQTQDRRIKAIHKENGGLSSARNCGIQHAKGEYILFLDSDDFWSNKSFLESVIQHLKIRDTDVIVFGMCIYYEKDDSTVPLLIFNKPFKGKTKTAQLESLISNNWIQSSACNKLIKKELFDNDELNFINGIFSEDIDWTARLLIKAKSFDVYPEQIYYYRQNDTSITHNITQKNMCDLFNNVLSAVKLGETVRDEDYYDYYMNYCSYQYITFINLLAQGYGGSERDSLLQKAKEYSWLLRYHINKKVKIVYLCKTILGFNGMMKMLERFLKGRNRY